MKILIQAFHFPFPLPRFPWVSRAARRAAIPHPADPARHAQRAGQLGRHHGPHRRRRGWAMRSASRWWWTTAPGPAASLGLEIGKNANPDGYTLITTSISALTVSPHIRKNLGYDPMKDFEYVAMYSRQGAVLVVHPGVPVKSVKDLIEFAKAQAGQAQHGLRRARLAPAISAAARCRWPRASTRCTCRTRAAGPPSPPSRPGEAQWTMPPSAAVMTLVRAGRLRALGPHAAAAHAAAARYPGDLGDAARIQVHRVLRDSRAARRAEADPREDPRDRGQGRRVPRDARAVRDAGRRTRHRHARGVPQGDRRRARSAGKLVKAMGLKAE